jgi:hypothetical protein
MWSGHFGVDVAAVVPRLVECNEVAGHHLSAEPSDQLIRWFAVFPSSVITKLPYGES